MIFMQEEYEHHIRIKSHLVVALEALKDAIYFLDRKQASIERQIYINAQNIQAHQEMIQIQLGDILNDFDAITDTFERVYNIQDRAHYVQEAIE